MDWERIIQDCHERDSFRTEWVRSGAGALFLLAWKAGGVRVLFVDLKSRLPEMSPAGVKEEFLLLLSHLRRRPQWDRIFKGRDVSFQWLMLVEATREECRTLELAGVEPFCFLDYWEKMGG